ncbi:rab-GTPase-TBC domain-containing protein [Dactylonectria estremocensis]|uniref:Rab-GTPase-TBC domain-containing protein n=1 Tax=Dactylonectria estremocensis TaxID=1079267 RepID=A0A9P9EV94_9HYPO|nr:rab-GTPase-TBC domain-containing protein [Dactylonectria estremocensis]
MDTDGPKTDHESLPSTILAESPSMMERDPNPETPKMAHDSMVTVRLSEPESLLLDSSTASLDVDTAQSTPTKDNRHDSVVGDFKPDVTIEEEEEDVADKDDDDKDSTKLDSDDDKADKAEASSTGEVVITKSARNSKATMPPPIVTRTLQDELREDNRTSDDHEEVNWEQLEKTEDEQTKDEETDNSTALLLARLEQENAKLATNPKSIKVQGVDRATAERSAVSKPRPPSMAQLRQMVQGPTPPALRYSMLPPPPMTDLEFYAALVKDYKQTAARLPTLLSNKIRKGIPPPLRGVVWQSMSGARDAALEETFERLSGESSPYEVIIGKDLGRSFPGVDMFRDPEGDGQRMLGRVLKCFSLYDTKIGYCQGLAFLVGPLLMHMPDNQAFCVLVRLMERYDLRACFLPDLSGLHVRIYQFRELLRQSLPVLSNHLEELQVNPAYVSQWFLSFFAVTCPLPMLFRIYDVIFAEGASETIMRVALSLMRKNEARLLSCTEMEDIMQLLLSRGLWDCYHYNADEFVQDFVALTGVVTRESMQQLEQSYKDTKTTTTTPGRGSEITTAASRFLGRIWASSTTGLSTKPANLSPGTGAPSRPLSMLRRSASKQSLASTLNSMEASSASVTSSVSTDATSLTRDSSNTEDGPLSRESTPVGSKSVMGQKNSDERHLHSQIEDLLTALSELQRNHALLSNQLQREREERHEDRKAIQSLLNGLRQKATSEPTSMDTTNPEVKISTVDDDKKAGDETPDVETLEQETAHKTTSDDEDADHRKSTDTSDAPESAKDTLKDDDHDKTEIPSSEDLSNLLDLVERRFQIDEDERRSSMLQSKAQLREELGHAKDQLASAMSQSQLHSRQINDLNQEMSSIKEQLRESHAHVRTLHQDKQRLEKQMHTLKTRASACSAHEPAREPEPEWPKANSVGLREFKLGRSKSTPSQANNAPSGPVFSKRMSSLPRPHEAAVPTLTTTAPLPPPTENEVLLLELVQAKTAEAMAKQEADEARQKLEALRKIHGLGHSEVSHSSSASQSGPMGVFGLLTGHGTSPATETPTKPAPSAGGSPSSGGGFWGWRR